MREFKNKIDFKLSLSKNYIFVQGWWNFVCFWTGYKIINFLFWGEIGIEQSRIRIVGGGGLRIGMCSNIDSIGRFQDCKGLQIR